MAFNFGWYTLGNVPACGMSCVFGINNFTVSTSTFTIPQYDFYVETGSYNTNTYPQAKWGLNGSIQCHLNINGTYAMDVAGYWSGLSVGDSSTWATTHITNTYTPGTTLTTSKYFNSNNPTAASVPITLEKFFVSAYSPIGGGLNTDGIMGSGGARIYLNAPPTFKTTDSGGTETTQVYFDTAYVYTGLTTASIKIANLSAKYGGSITSATLTIGDQTVSRTNNGELSILLNTGGTFIPTVTVTDSRGQTTTKTLDKITVNVYTTPTVNFEAQRTLATGVPDDEGTYVVISPKFTFIDVIAELRPPTITATDEGSITYTPTVTWHSTRASDGTLSGSVTWSSLSTGDTVYGLLSLQSGFDVLQSYEISVTPIDSEGTGTAKTQMLAPAFFTIDVLAGGHGVAFGQPASQVGFFCNMDAHFVDANDVMRALFDFVYPVGSYYETSDTFFDPNTTWGGTWILETAGQVHVSAGTGYAIAGALTNTTDGGESTHTLNVQEMPSHTHNQGTRYSASLGAYAPNLPWTSNSGTYTEWQTTIATGGGKAHNNMQPYIVVNRWHRTA